MRVATLNVCHGSRGKGTEVDPEDPVVTGQATRAEAEPEAEGEEGEAGEGAEGEGDGGRNAQASRPVAQRPAGDPERAEGSLSRDRRPLLAGIGLGVQRVRLADAREPAQQPLRLLDFLIHEPVRTVLLHRSGVPVVVPAPARYAIHKLIVASRRQSDANRDAKREKDLHQASLMVEALRTTRRLYELGYAFEEAFSCGPSWREAIEKGLRLLPDKPRELTKTTIKEAWYPLAWTSKGSPIKFDIRRSDIGIPRCAAWVHRRRDKVSCSHFRKSEDAGSGSPPSDAIRLISTFR